MKRKAVALSLVLALLISAVAGTQLINLGKANPWMGTDWVSPKDDTKPPAFTISSPQENRTFNSRTVFLNFNATIGEAKNASCTRLMQVYYKTDWQQNETCVYDNKVVSIPYDSHAITEFAYNITLTGVPDGKHSITFHAVEWGAYIEGLFVHMFTIDGFSSVNFTVNATTAEAEAFLFATVATASITAVVLVVTGLRVYFKKRSRVGMVDRQKVGEG